MSIIYKTLFEVKILHEYYHTDIDGKTIFARVDQEDRIGFLNEQERNDKDTINKDLDFVFPSFLAETYSHYNLKLVSTYSGFKVAVRVNKRNLADRSLVYEPMVALPDKFAIYVLFNKKDNGIDRISNTRINSALPALYFFSNDEVAGEQTFPFLTNNISAIRSSYKYEQGELASFGSSDIRAYYQNEYGDQWASFKGSDFVNENDRLFLPLKFYYSFPAERDISEADFVLKNKNGITIKSITTSSNSKINKCVIDLSALQGSLPDPLVADFSDLILTLEVNGNDGYTASHKVFLSDNFYSKDIWGMVGLHPKTASKDFELLTEEGYLKRFLLGTESRAPLFEIPVKSRSAYWRYINNRGKKLQLAGELNGYLEEDDALNLISLKPGVITQSFFLMENNTGSATKYVPNPVNYDIKKDKKNRLCYDIIVQQSDLFPIVP
ncbi:MAG: hypothetical protein QM737_15375 [Ferruginibacter sp.]